MGQRNGRIQSSDYFVVIVYEIFQLLQDTVFSDGVGYVFRKTSITNNANCRFSKNRD